MSDDKLDESKEYLLSDYLEYHEYCLKHSLVPVDIINTQVIHGVVGSHYPLWLLHESATLIKNVIPSIFDQCISDLYSNPSAKWHEILAVYLLNAESIFSPDFTEENRTKIPENITPYEFFFTLDNTLQVTTQRNHRVF